MLSCSILFDSILFYYKDVLQELSWASHLGVYGSLACSCSEKNRVGVGSVWAAHRGYFKFRGPGYESCL